MNSLQTLFFYASHLTPNAGIAKECITDSLLYHDLKILFLYYFVGTLLVMGDDHV